MTGNVRQTPPEPTCGTLWVTCDNSPTFDGTGPQNAPEGTVDMNSIDNLRDYVLTAPSICSTTRAILVGYIDGIEREVADMVPMPVDADGEPIHVGDVVMDADVREIVERVMQIRYTLETSSKAPTVLTSIITDASQLPQKPSSYRHHHAPTVEDVLREFAEKMNENLGMYTGEAIDADEWRDADADTIAEYAAKLALRGDE